MEIRAGDLFFTTSTSLFSAGVRFFTHGKYSHVQIITQVKEIDGALAVDVVSADAAGVILRSVQADEWPRHAILTYPNMTHEERDKILKFCFASIGAGYDYAGITDFLFDVDFQGENRFFCSELAFLAYKSAGINLQERLDHAFVSPDLLYISPLLKVVEESYAK